MRFQSQWVLIHISLQLMGMFSLNLEIQLKPVLGATVYPAQEQRKMSFSEMFCKANLS